jgi:hypothetical protein
LQLAHPVLTLGLLVRTRFALAGGAADGATRSDEAEAVEATEVVLVEVLAAETDGLLVVAMRSVLPAPVTGVAGVLVEAGETLLLL